MQELVSEAFTNLVTPEFVRNCYDNVREQEDYYRHLHNHEPLPVEEVEEVEELILRFDKFLEPSRFDPALGISINGSSTNAVRLEKITRLIPE